MPGLARGDSGYTRLILALFLAGVATFGQLYAVQGILPILVTEFDVSEASAALSLSVASIGVAVGVLPWAALGHRYDLLALLKVALLGSAACGLLTPLSSSWPLFLGLRFVDGLILAAVPALAFSFIAERFSGRWIPAVAGSFVAGNTIGGLAGRILAGVTGSAFGWQTALLVVGALCVAAAAAFACVAPGVLNPSQPLVSQRREGFLGGLGRALTDRGLWGLYVQPCLLMGVFLGVYNYLPFRLTASPLNVPLAISSSLFAVYLVGTVSSRISGTYITRHGHRPVLLTAISSMVLGIAVMLTPNLVTITLGLAIFTAGYFCVAPAASSWVIALSTGRGNLPSSVYQLVYYAGSGIVSWAVGLAFVAAGWLGLSLAVGLLCLGSAGASFLTPTAPRLGD